MEQSRRDRFEPSNATVRWTVAGDGLTEPNLNFSFQGTKNVTNLAGTCFCYLRSLSYFLRNRNRGSGLNHFILDFKGIESLLGLHHYFKQVFGLPDYYGNNMDALWDCLACCYDENTEIELKNIAALPADMEPVIRIMLELFQDLHEEDGVIIKISENTASDDLTGYLI